MEVTERSIDDTALYLCAFLLVGRDFWLSALIAWVCSALIAWVWFPAGFEGVLQRCPLVRGSALRHGSTLP